MFRDEHMNSYTIFQSAQLLEGLSPFQWARFPTNEPEEQIAAETINALVPQKNGATAPRIGNWRSRKIKSTAFRVDHNFHLVR